MAKYKIINYETITDDIEKSDNKGFIKLIRLSNPKYKLLCIGIILLMVTSSIQVYIPTLVANLTNSFTNGIDYKVVAKIFILLVFSMIFSAAGGTILGIFGESIIKKLRRILLKKVLNFKISYFDTVKSGEISSRVSNDIIQIKQLLSDVIPQAIASLITIFGTLYMMIKTDWHMTLIIFLTIPILVIIIFPVMALGTKIGDVRQDNLAQFNGVVNEIVSEIRLIKSSNAEQQAFANANVEIKKLYNTGKNESLFDAVIQPKFTSLIDIFMIILYS